MKNNKDKNSPLKFNLYDGILTQPTQISALSPNNTGLKLKFGSELPNVYGAGTGLSSSYSGLNLGGAVTNLMGGGGSAGGGESDAAKKKSGGFNMASASGMGILSGIGNIASGLIGRGDRRDAQIAAQKDYDNMLNKYKDLDTSNLYANVQNAYGGIQTNFENVYEDLTVNQQQAQFQAQQGAQQRSNIMQTLRGAAGGSGIAGLAQAMAAQGQLATQQASASIGQQEAMNQRLLAQGAANVQQMENQAQLIIAGGEAQAEQLRLQGAADARGLKYQQTSTLLGMAQQEKAERDRAVAEGNAALYGGIGQLVGGALGFIGS